MSTIALVSASCSRWCALRHQLGAHVSVDTCERCQENGSCPKTVPRNVGEDGTTRGHIGRRVP